MKKKKGVKRDWNKGVIAGVFVLGILVVIGSWVYFSNNDPDNLVPSDKTISGNAFYSNDPLTLEQLRDGVGLDRGWNRFLWTDEIDEDLDLKVAFESILDNNDYVYGYSERKYWFSPNGNYARYNNYYYYKNRVLDKIKPGNKYGVRMGGGDVLEYSVGPRPMKIIDPSGYERIVGNNNLYCVDNQSYVNCGGETDGGLDYNVKGMVANVTKPDRVNGTVIPGKLEIFEDECVGANKIKEYYCNPNSRWYGAEVHTVSCPNNGTCSDGACVDVVVQCADSDNGKNYFVKGYVESSNRPKTFDSCVNDSVLEGYCYSPIGSNDTFSDIETYSCSKLVSKDKYWGSYGCVDGACVPNYHSCNDTDGGKNLSLNGTTTVGSESKEDYCVSSSRVMEHTCSEVNDRHNNTYFLIATRNEICFNGCSFGKCN